MQPRDIVLEILSDCHRGRAHVKAVHGAMKLRGIEHGDIVTALDQLDQAGQVVEDRHNRGVIVLTAEGLVRARGVAA